MRRIAGRRAPGSWRRGAGVAVTLLVAAGCARPAVRELTPAPVPAGWEETGKASWYGRPYHGRRTASGEVYDMAQMTAAHRTLPFGTWVVVENRLNGRTAEVRITDRGPFVADRILDLSWAAARVLGAVDAGVIPVRLRVVAPPGTAARGEGGGFAVQVGAFSSAYRAALLREELGRTWTGAYVEEAELGGRRIYRVRLGGYPTRAEAHRVATRLAAAGFQVMVVAVDAVTPPSGR